LDAPALLLRQVEQGCIPSHFLFLFRQKSHGLFERFETCSMLACNINYWQDDAMFHFIKTLAVPQSAKISCAQMPKAPQILLVKLYVDFNFAEFCILMPTLCQQGCSTLPAHVFQD
jgi:hypothetical protein